MLYVLAASEYEDSDGPGNLYAPFAAESRYFRPHS